MQNKTISRFLNSEEGKILNADVVKLGVSLGIVGSALTDAETVSAAITNLHNNYFLPTGAPLGYNNTSNVTVAGYTWTVSNWTDPNNGHYSHTAHSSHGSHGSHGSHARGGWC